MNKLFDCALCLIFGTLAPWALIVSGAILSYLNISEAFNKGAAYAVAFGLFVLACSAILRHLSNKMHIKHPL